AGNITQELVTPPPERFQFTTPVNMTYTAANRLATYNGEAVQFDADGNMTKGPLSGDMANFVFDSRNRLMAAGNTAYRYDAENQRIGVSIDGQETRYVINSVPVLSQVLVRTQPDGTQTYYVHGLGLIGQEQQGQYLSYHFDLRGSTVALTNETGQVVERFQYSPYGLLLSGDASRTPFLFNGMYGVMTDGNELYYMRARYYHPEIRRFVNQDILLGVIFEGQTLNRYAFVTGQPVSFVDPFGFDKTQPEIILNPTITKKQLDDLFNQIKQMDLVLNRPSNGCEARAYLISRAILTSSYQPYQVWLINDRTKLKLKGKDYEWRYHTANMVKLPDGTRMVIDLVVSPDKPITVTDWKKYFSNIQHSSEAKFGTPPLICEGAKPCRYRRVDGSYAPDRKDSEYSSLEEQARNTLACYKEVDIGSIWGNLTKIFYPHCRAME
ncbi:MAG: hypothetical protein DRR19_22555, partial [Candidatus Parabeggiatoa sp. nov. 1]